MIPCNALQSCEQKGDIHMVDDDSTSDMRIGSGVAILYGCGKCWKSHFDMTHVTRMSRG